MKFAHANDVVLSYRLSGPETAPTLVFSNSLGTDYRIWDGVVDRLNGQFRTICYDQRGHGLSSVPLAPYSIADHAADLAGLLDGLGVDSAIICGLSIGGMIAQQLASDRPDLVRALILSDTAHAIGPRDIWDKRIEQVREGGLAPLADSVLDRWFGTTYRRDHHDQLAGWANMLSRVPPESYVGSCAALRDADLTDSTAKLTLATMCVCGSEDGPTPPDLVRSLAALIPGSSFELIEGAGHLPCVENAERFASLIVNFAEANNLV